MPRAGASLKTIQNKEAAFKKVKAHNDKILKERAQKKQAMQRLQNMKK